MYLSDTSYYNCAPQRKFDGIDEFINLNRGSSPEYFECGDFHPENTNKNLCGIVGSKYYGTYATYNYEAEACDDLTCHAQYNARAVECLPAEFYSTSAPLGMGTLVQPISSEQNCNYCPFFCRVTDSSGTSICEGSLSSFYSHYSCDDTSQCDLRTSQTPDFANPFGYCSISDSVFNIGSTCKSEIPKMTACPLRCRIDISSNKKPMECEDGEIMQACDYVLDECKVTPLSSPCSSCNNCLLEACTQTPKVWTDCSLCAKTASSGTTSVSMSDLSSSLSGAKGTRTEWRNIGSVGVPAIVLPILGVITTLAFIRSLSPVLGGDIEIPGLMKLI